MPKSMPQFQRLSDVLWEVPREGRMRVPARIYASEAMLRRMRGDQAHQQAANVACLPGIVTAALAMPDFHWGYGFPIGGVAAFDVDEGVVSPGGVGYDINCGVRLMASQLTRDAIAPVMREIMQGLYRAVPCGIGSTAALSLDTRQLEHVAVEGAAWAVGRGYGSANDLEHIETGGGLQGADPSEVSARAAERGRNQVGTLGAGNHFLEVGYVDEIYDETAAAAFGLFKNQVILMLHCGSRGYGHQVCDDALARMTQAARKYAIELPDPQLACAPVASDEGRAYLAAMRCAVNFAFANRQVVAHLARKALEHTLRLGPREIGLRTVYEVTHNIAKLETHTVDGRPRRLCVHRKGATRAFPAGTGEVPAAYRAVGQPVLIPGDMGRCSYVLTGTPRAMTDTFGSTCHGAGRLLSRRAAQREARRRDIVSELEHRNVVVIAHSRRTVNEEMPDAYKNVDDVVDICVRAGLSRKVARLIPMGCMKG